ncbi:unnamed protein product [Acanthoscelides obtectus]|uniref:Uncharacterized protein n=1 Tax=Acanthoscelides obtectus TaxID=200917 RepID=A0A9P0Q337_ACAOB|nr:unnamed protein product [Acanthoscelides obtectus]CAH2019984.1 unnamed protein product [Acanthoscelides obtectus]CAK1648806.1 hypothetical protein AOBTE_LOCUS15889 [Acanthoscelides obtectus]CAK1648813.1 hypothetical protein AOBTE_LOCUS15895 [Acanthoscelides obtectus]
MRTVFVRDAKISMRITSLKVA